MDTTIISRFGTGYFKSLNYFPDKSEAVFNVHRQDVSEVYFSAKARRLILAEMLQQPCTMYRMIGFLLVKSQNRVSWIRTKSSKRRSVLWLHQHSVKFLAGQTGIDQFLRFRGVQQLTLPPRR